MDNKQLELTEIVHNINLGVQLDDTDEETISHISQQFGINITADHLAVFEDYLNVLADIRKQINMKENQ